MTLHLCKALFNIETLNAKTFTGIASFILMLLSNKQFLLHCCVLHTKQKPKRYMGGMR
jgi:hypothetical protein